MPDQKISELPAVTSLDLSESVPVVQSGATKRATLAQVQSSFVVPFGPADFTDTSDGSAPDRLRYTVITGGAAGDLTVTGVGATDRLRAVIRLDRDSTAANVSLGDLTAEFTVTAADTINNTGGTNTTGDKLLIVWQGGITLGLAAFDPTSTESVSIVRWVPGSWATADVYVLALATDAGNVRLQADPFGSGAVATTLTIAAPFTLTRHRVLTNVAVSPSGPIVTATGSTLALCQVRLDRLGADGADTLTSDLLIAGGEIVKVT